MKHFIFASICLPILAVAACETTVPASDTTPPILTVWLPEESPVRLIASSVEDEDLVQGCPTGTSAAPGTVEQWVTANYGWSMSYTLEVLERTYFYEGELPQKYWLIARDPEGIFSMASIGHAPDEYAFADDHSNDFGSPPDGTNAQAVSYDRAEVYAFESPLHPPNSESIIIYDLRPEGDASSAMEAGDLAIDGLLLQISPYSLGTAPHFYVSAVNIAGNTMEEKRSMMDVHLLPVSLCE